MLKEKTNQKTFHVTLNSNKHLYPSGDLHQGPGLSRDRTQNNHDLAITKLFHLKVAPSAINVLVTFNQNLNEGSP